MACGVPAFIIVRIDVAEIGLLFGNKRNTSTVCPGYLFLFCINNILYEYIMHSRKSY
jgi:hypothetical protein